MLSFLLLAVACDSKEVACKPKHLVEMSDCQGEDNSKETCQYYYRSIGTPDQQWCQKIQQKASQNKEMKLCDFNKAESWMSMSCAAYGFDSKMNCYGCVMKEGTSSKSYVFAYDTACSMAIEQVTCNVSPISVKDKL